MANNIFTNSINQTLYEDQQMSNFFKNYMNNRQSSIDSIILTDNDILSDISKESTQKTPKQMFETAKIYHKYLSSIKAKLNNLNSIDHKKTDIFNKFYNNANTYFEDINNDWFWLSTDDKIAQFRLKSLSSEDLKLRIMKNYLALEDIVKLYGFDKWFANKLNKYNQMIKINTSFETSSNVTN